MPVGNDPCHAFVNDDTNVISHNYRSGQRRLYKPVNSLKKARLLPLRFCVRE